MVPTLFYILKDEYSFLDSLKIRNLVKTYSDHIAFEILMQKEPEKAQDDKEDKKEKAQETVEYEAINKAKALWLRAKSELKDEDYESFYREVSHYDFEAPLTWSQGRRKLDYTSLFYIPKNAPFDLWDPQLRPALNFLYKEFSLWKMPIFYQATCVLFVVWLILMTFH